MWFCYLGDSDKESLSHVIERVSESPSSLSFHDRALSLTILTCVPQGPMYSTPLMGFIDDACLIFDTEEENKLEYTQTHEDFKQLVDTLISDYLLELGVAPEQFAQVREGE
jgi:hypothetical protein